MLAVNTALPATFCPALPAVRNEVEQRWRGVRGSEERWEALKEVVEAEAQVGGVGWVRGRGSLPVGLFACSCASVLLHLPQL
jgi:hypothetical protein